MTRATKALALAVVAALGLWGCAEGQGNGGAAAERVRALENKCAKLEDDYRAVASARDGLRKKLTATEEERVRLHQDLAAKEAVVKERQALAKERDELAQQVSTRTGERDAAQAQLEQVRKGLRSLLGQADASATGQPQPAVSAAPDGSGGGKS
jgi:uncharacterized coiled-coil DUF342 family protein